jgi:predicted nucleotidyltransferase
VLKESLEDLFVRKVDLVAVEAIRNRFFREEVEETRVQLYAA